MFEVLTRTKASNGKTQYDVIKGMELIASFTDPDDAEAFLAYKREKQRQQDADKNDS